MMNQSKDLIPASVSELMVKVSVGQWVPDMDILREAIEESTITARPNNIQPTPERVVELLSNESFGPYMKVYARFFDAVRERDFKTALSMKDDYDNALATLHERVDFHYEDRRAAERYTEKAGMIFSEEFEGVTSGADRGEKLLEE